MNASDLLSEVRTYYTARVMEHGPTPRGADWNSAESQRNRFEQLLRICDRTEPFRLGDYGCGYGGLFDYLCQGNWDGFYSGYDISPLMLETARRRHAGDHRARFEDDDSVLAEADYVVASGVFNVKLKTPRPEWEAYVLQTLQRMAKLARRGFAFNVLTSYSDPERVRPDLYYADPCFMFDYCKRTFSRHVALLHDYGLYEFTMLVRLEVPGLTPARPARSG
jgi:SAM-dependent methyltransferase